MSEKREPPRLQPCAKNGEHVVENIKPLDPDDKESDAYLIEAGYKFVGICKHCKNRIVAKDKKEYNNFFEGTKK